MDCTKFLFFTFTIGFLVTSCSSGNQQKEDESSQSVETIEYLDATVVSSDNYKLLSEDGNVRLIEMTLEAGTMDSLHSHNYESVYFLTGGKVKIYVGDELMEAEIPDGHVMHHGPWNHIVENVGETTVRAILFEQMKKGDSIGLEENFIDPVLVAAENYTLLSQEGNVRVISMTLMPGQSDIEHSHMTETVYFISGGKAKIYAGEEVMEADLPDGHVMHHGPWTHRVENVGETSIQAIIFERI
jgi:beta-alanine degradation protein BauB